MWSPAAGKARKVPSESGAPATTAESPATGRGSARRATGETSATAVEKRGTFDETARKVGPALGAAAHPAIGLRAGDVGPLAGGPSPPAAHQTGRNTVVKGDDGEEALIRSSTRLAAAEAARRDGCLSSVFVRAPGAAAP